jgi:hypothetical protein
LYGGANPTASINLNIVLNDESDTPYQGTTITAGSEYSRAISYIGDVDWFRFNPSDTITYTITVTGDSSLRVELYKQDDNLGNLVTVGSCAGNQLLKELCNQNDPYFVKVYSVNDTLGAYKIKTTTSYIDKYEPNNAFNAAKAIELAEYSNIDGSFVVAGSIYAHISATIHSVADVDYYKITISEAIRQNAVSHGFLTAEVSLDARDRYDLAVFDNNHNLFDVNVSNYSDDYKLVSLPLETQGEAVYYIRVYPYMANISSKIPYTITINTTPSKQRGGETFGWGIQKPIFVASSVNTIKYKFGDG